MTNLGRTTYRGRWERPLYVAMDFIEIGQR